MASFGYFPQMRWEGFLFFFGGLGWTCVRSTPLLRPQLLATVCTRQQPSAMIALWSCLWGVMQSCHFWRFQNVTSFRVAGMALRDIETCFITCQRALRERRITFTSFGRHALWRPPARSASDVSFYLLFVNRIVPAASSDDNAQILRQA